MRLTTPFVHVNKKKIDRQTLFHLSHAANQPAVPNEWNLLNKIKGDVFHHFQLDSRLHGSGQMNNNEIRLPAIRVRHTIHRICVDWTLCSFWCLRINSTLWRSGVNDRHTLFELIKTEQAHDRKKKRTNLNGTRSSLYGNAFWLQ